MVGAMLVYCWNLGDVIIIAWLDSLLGNVFYGSVHSNFGFPSYGSGILGEVISCDKAKGISTVASKKLRYLYLS